MSVNQDRITAGSSHMRNVSQQSQAPIIGDNSTKMGQTKLPLLENKNAFASVFTFFVGKESEPMMIHTNLLADLSPALRSLVKGPMQDAQKGTTSWEDVEKETFTMFAQFVYTRDYKPLPPTEKNHYPAVDLANAYNMSSILFRSETHANTQEHTAVSKKPAKTSLKRRVIAKPSSKRKFHELEYPVQHANLLVDACKPQGSCSSTEDFTPVFLGHARLYTLADKYGVEALKNAVLYKLHVTLCDFILYPARYGEIVELIRYTYDHTPARKTVDSLRRLVSTYIASAGKEISLTEPCTTFIGECPEFALDLLMMKLEEEK